MQHLPEKCRWCGQDFSASLAFEKHHGHLYQSQCLISSEMEESLSCPLICPHRFLDLLAKLLPALQQFRTSWRGKSTSWVNGGCLILAQGLFIWMRQSLHARGITRLRRLPLPSRPQLVAVWESWDEEPYHAGIRIGEYFLDGEGIRCISSELSSWEEYFRGGAYLAPLPTWAVTEYGFLVQKQLSVKIALSLKKEFGVFDPYKRHCLCSSILSSRGRIIL